MNGRGIIFLVAFILLSGIAFIIGRATGPQDGQTVTAVQPTTVTGKAATKGSTADKQTTPSATATPAPEKRGPTYPYDKYEVGDWSVNAIHADDREIWVGTTGGVVRYKVGDKDYEFFDNMSGLLSNGILSIEKSGDEIWLGTYGGGLSVFDRGTQSWRNYNINNGLGDPFVRDILIDKGGDAWIATWSGLNRVKDKNLDGFADWELFTTESTAGGLPHNRIYALAEDNAGAIWVATEKGVARFQNRQWTQWTHENGLGAAEDLVADSLKKGTKADRPTPNEDQTGERPAYKPDLVVSLTVGDDGRIWAGTWGGGLSVFDGTSWSTFTMWDGLPGNYILALAKGPRNGVWVGTGNGLAWFDGVESHIFRTEEGLFGDVVRSFGPESTTDIWVGGMGGVSHFPKGLGILPGNG